MDRRSVLKAFGALFVTRRAVGTLAFSLPEPAPQSATFTTAEVTVLTAIAEVVLPSALTVDDRRIAVRSFVSWIANYKAGADMGHGYGSSTLRGASGPSPIARYAPQFNALAAAAKERGSTAFAALPLAARRDVVESMLNGAPPVTRLPAQPTGANLVADFMGSYFNSQDGWNLCYKAAINRDSCRTLVGSEDPPEPIRG